MSVIFTPGNLEKSLLNLAISVIRVYPQHTTVNPYTRINLPVRAPKKEQFKKLLKLLVHSSTLINHTYRQRNKNGHYMSTREDYINGLSLVKELSRLYQEQPTKDEMSFIEMIRRYCHNNESFSRKDFETISGYGKTHSQRLILLLLKRGLIECTGGSKNRGYRYRLKEIAD